MHEMSPTDGGSAFPSEQGTDHEGLWNQTYDPGMSLRDWFAGQALAGLLAKETFKPGDPARLALIAYVVADAMLKERDLRS